MEEIWKDIKGYEGLYQVSNMGNVRSLNYHQTGQIQILRPWATTGGYLRVNLRKDGKGKNQAVHRLVAQAFIPNPNGFTEINHKDEDKTNNRMENLEWCDRIYNLNYGTRSERSAHARRNHPRRSKQVLCVETGAVYPSGREAERKTGLFNGSISKACLGKHKTAGGFHWEYVQ